MNTHFEKKIIAAILRYSPIIAANQIWEELVNNLAYINILRYWTDNRQTDATFFALSDSSRSKTERKKFHFNPKKKTF